jgi:hypothetical protein
MKEEVQEVARMESKYYFPTLYSLPVIRFISLSGIIPTDRLDMYLNLNQLQG